MSQPNERLQLLAALWQTRAPRERRFLAGLASFLVVALFAQGLWSAHEARQRLHRQLPQLRQKLDTLQRQAGEIRQMQSQPVSPTAPEGAALLAAANAAAQTTGLTLAAGQLQLEGSRQLRVRATLPFDRWLEWVAALQRDARLRLVHCRVDALDGGGMGDGGGQAKIDALFSLPEPT